MAAPQPMYRGEVVREILSVLLSGRFARNPRTLTPALESAVMNCVESNGPLKLLLLWGKGHKDLPDRAETQACQFLLKFRERLTRAWPQAFHLKVLFTDTHAMINGYSSSTIRSYFGATQEVLAPLTTDWGWLSTLWWHAGITYQDVKAAAATDNRDWADLEESLHLTDRAARYGLSPDHVTCAKTYVAARNLENAIIRREYPDWIYLTSDSVEMLPLLPDMPILHLYSRQRGWCEKPWNSTLHHR